MILVMRCEGGVVVMMVAVDRWRRRRRWTTCRRRATTSPRASGSRSARRFAEAAEEYEAAYQAKDDPALLFNLGQAYRLAGNRSRRSSRTRRTCATSPTAATARRSKSASRAASGIGAQPPPARLASAPRRRRRDSRRGGDPRWRETARLRRLEQTGRRADPRRRGLGVVGAGIAFAVLSKQAGDAAYRPTSGTYDFGADERQGRYRAAESSASPSAAPHRRRYGPVAVGRREGTR